VYLLSEAYPDEQLLSLIGRASEAIGKDVDATVHDFGVFTAQSTFTRLYPAFFAIAGSAREFMLSVETRIHELVRATIPNAGPPQLDVSELDGDGVTIVYSSPRRRFHASLYRSMKPRTFIRRLSHAGATPVRRRPAA
jgi:hypothetical protein